jgi:hypothetical protein
MVVLVIEVPSKLCIVNGVVRVSDIILHKGTLIIASGLLFQGDYIYFHTGFCSVYRRVYLPDEIHG